MVRVFKAQNGKITDNCGNILPREAYTIHIENDQTTLITKSVWYLETFRSCPHAINSIAYAENGGYCLYAEAEKKIATPYEFKSISIDQKNMPFWYMVDETVVKSIFGGNALMSNPKCPEWGK